MLALPLNLPSPSPDRDSSEDELQANDDLSWLTNLAAKDRTACAQRLRWVRLVDRLAAEGLLEGDGSSLLNHDLMPQEPARLGVSWCEAWQGYLAAAARYQHPQSAPRTLQQHGEMLLELGGNALCLMPGVDWYLRRSIAHFGALDCFWRDLRGLSDASRHGRCPFPVELLARFGLAPRDFVGGRWRHQPGYPAFMRYWLDRYLPTLRREAEEFRGMTGLPQPLLLLRRACLERHERIERSLRRASYDFEQASREYWAEVAARQPTRAALRSCA